MAKNTMTKAAIRQRQRASRTHGIYAFRDRGPEALDNLGVTRLTELRELVRSHPGRQDLRAEMTARVALICELGFVELRQWAEEGKSIWSSPMIKRAATWIAELRRLLDSFPEDDELRIDATAVLSKVRKPSGKSED